MPRPETAQDVLDIVRQSGLVSSSALTGIHARVTSAESRERAFALLIAEGVLTRYQANELSLGNGKSLWLGGYRVLDRLGKGGMSQVYLAEHAVLSKRVAVKVLSADLRANPIARKRFVREARAAAAIDHHNIVQVFDVDMDHDPPYLVMEYVEGISLQAAVAGHGALTGVEAAMVGSEVARGLAVAAAAGLVHRNVKPANLLLDRRGGIKILDLGIVRLVGDDTHPPGTENDEILGTIDYLAPEQAVNPARVDGRADLYALGATLYFLLAGHPPFPGGDLRHKLAAKRFADPLPIHRLRPDIEPALSEIIHTLLKRDLASRCQSATEACEALSRHAALPSDFPAHFFRPVHLSTICDDDKGSNDYALPITHCIRKPGPPSTAVVHPNADAPIDAGPPTLRMSKAMTDMVMDALPNDVPLPRVAERKLPPVPPRPTMGYFELAMAALLSAVIVAVAVRYWFF